MVKISLFILLFIGFAMNLSIAQIPNAGFENWTGGIPDGWSVTNTPLFTTVTQTTDAHSGSAAAHCAVVSFAGNPIPPIMTSAIGAGAGFPIAERYNELRGFYKLSPVGGDSFFISAVLEKGNAGIAAGMFNDGGSVTTYKEFVVPIEYTTSETPDTGWIMMTVQPPESSPHHVGTAFDIDDLSFSTTTGVNDLSNGLPKVFRIEQNYPNPFNPTTGIVYDVPMQTHVRLTVFDVLGRKVTALVDEIQPAGRYKAVFDASSLPSGVYFYRFNAGKFLEVKKMLLAK